MLVDGRRAGTRSTGAIQCRSQFDPSAAVHYFSARPTDPRSRRSANARLAADIAACVPYNPFGGADNSACRRIFLDQRVQKARDDAVRRPRLRQRRLEPVVRASRRSGRLRARRRVSPRNSLLSRGSVRRLAGGGSASPTRSTSAISIRTPFHVAEAFAEINVPILKDMPFFHELTFRARAVTHATWRRSRAYGPTISAASGRPSGTSASAATSVNRCALRTCRKPASRWSRTSRRPSRIRAAPMARSAQVRPGPRLARRHSGHCCQRSGTAPTRWASTAAATRTCCPRVSYSLTLGAVVQPRFLPNFSFSVDYYRIKVKGVIAARHRADRSSTIATIFRPATSSATCSSACRCGHGRNGETPGNVVFGVTSRRRKTSPSASAAASTSTPTIVPVCHPTSCSIPA